ncbi:zinc finger protein 490-like isoform X8 [Mercenaria mercenaria]|uniref:zinc finger protein 490-like isoform X8 n=1 Tax=Mercenaria mercenaria TaxID=6596 RepID=UPI00234F2C20|nr:zinc finger protein 490-like isoform X8 [Mercenaria mercenaria]
MAAPDLDVIKDIPGYKVILKAVLKSQIQQLVEQLASTTEEESVILTASVADGTLSHLGSQSGKGFLEDHEDIKSQFLGFCLKKHHRDKQEKERQEAEAALIQATQAAARQRSPRGPYPARSPRFSSPHGPGPIHPVALTRSPRGGGMISPGNRHEPYPAARPSRRTSTEPSPVKVNNGSGQVIKVELDTHSNENDTINQDTDQSSSHQSNAPSSVKSESGEKDEDAQSESSNSTIPNEPLAEGISLDSDLSNVISGPSHTQSGESSEIDPNVSVKIEALTESEMELEITGVEPGRPVVPQDNWDPNISLGMNFDPSQGATGNQADMSGQGYNAFPNQSLTCYRGVEDSATFRGYSVIREGEMSIFVCLLENCGKKFGSRQGIERHIRVHTKEKPFKCRLCNYCCSRKDSLKIHESKHLFDNNM